MKNKRKQQNTTLIVVIWLLSVEKRTISQKPLCSKFDAWGATSPCKRRRFCDRTLRSPLKGQSLETGNAEEHDFNPPRA